MLRMKRILQAELMSRGAVVRPTQFNERRSIEQLFCLRNSCTFWPDDRPLWKGKKGRCLNGSPNAGRTEPKWLTGSSCASLDMKSVMQFCCSEDRSVPNTQTCPPLISVTVLQEPLKCLCECECIIIIKAGHSSLITLFGNNGRV